MRILGVEPAVAKREECAFYSDGYCKLDDRLCKIVSKHAVRRYGELGFRDHFEIYIARRRWRVERLLEIISVGASLAACIIAVVALVIATRPTHSSETPGGRGATVQLERKTRPVDVEDSVAINEQTLTEEQESMKTVSSQEEVHADPGPRESTSDGLE